MCVFIVLLYFVLFAFSGFTYVACFPSVLCYCWLGLLTCNNGLPYNLYCVGGDVKHWSNNQSIFGCIASGCWYYCTTARNCRLFFLLTVWLWWQWRCKYRLWTAVQSDKPVNKSSTLRRDEGKWYDILPVTWRRL